MARDDSHPSRDPERKRAASGADAHDRRGAGWAPRRGRSGYGVESIRPHLHEQLERQKLLRPTFPPDPPPEGDGRPD